MRCPRSERLRNSGDGNRPAVASCYSTAALWLVAEIKGSASTLSGENRWDENAGLRRDAIRSQVIDALKAQEIRETGNEED